MQITKKDLLFVYDIFLHRILQANGFQLLTSAISLKDKQFWLYQRTPEVERLMKEYSKKN